VSRYREQVAAAVRAVTIRGPAQYAWLGHRSRRLPPSLNGELSVAEQRSYLVACLREELYFSFYCHGAPVPARWGEPEPVSADPWLVEEMSAANAGRGGWDPGWTVQRIEGDEVVVANSRLRMRAARADCDGRVVVGASVDVRRPRDLPALSPGYWTVLGDAPDSPSGASVRVYWHVTRGGAPALVGALTRGLNEAGLPFRLKIADHPFRLDRCDAAVLYLDGDVFRSVRPALADVAAELIAHLRPEIPAFTLELAPGAGLAEDDTGESFGVRRCATLADGIVLAHEHGLSTVDERVGAIVARFAEEGVAIDAPYLAGCHVL
jgi:hypothetical protein